MKKTYTAILLISTLLFGLWYFILFQYVERHFTSYQKTLSLDEKNCLQAHNLSRSCSIEKESLAALHVQYQSCVDQTKNCDRNEAVMQLIIELLDNNNLVLDHYKQIAKEKKNWFSRYSSSLSFHGSMRDVLLFFEQLTMTPITITPDAIEIHTNNQHISQVATTISWIVYTKKSPST